MVLRFARFQEVELNPELRRNSAVELGSPARGARVRPGTPVVRSFSGAPSLEEDSTSD